MQKGEKTMLKFSDILTVQKAKKKPKTDAQKLTGCFKIQKSNDDKMLVFGWASVAITTEGEQVDDFQDDIIDPEDLENAAYDFVQFYRDGSEMHERGGVATLVESVVFTKEKQAAIGIPDGTLPEGWWIGFRVTDTDVWDKIKDGTYSMFSIEGTAIREETEEAE
jgi:hypothetical protein